MLRYSLTSLLAAKGRLLLTALAIVLGVGAVAGTFVLIDTAEAAADAAFGETTPRVDVVVRAVPQGEGEVLSDITGELFATPIPAATVGRAERVHGVAAAVGVVSGSAQLLGRDGHVIGVRAPLGRSIDPSWAGSLLAGRVPTAPGEVAIDQVTADDQGFGVGDQVQVLPSGGEPRGRRAGRVRPGHRPPAAHHRGPGQLPRGPRRRRRRRAGAARPGGGRP